MKRLIKAAVLAALAAALTPAVAAASITTVSYSAVQNRILVSADADDANDIAISQQIIAGHTTYKITEAGTFGLSFSDISLTETASQCTKNADPNIEQASCTIDGLSFIEVRLAKGDDNLEAQDPVGSDPVTTNMLVSVTDTLLDDTDFISTGNGIDTVDTGIGDDTVTAGDGNDIVAGGAGEDDLDGEAGNDIIDGGDGDDLSLVGNVGNDTITGGAGADGLAGDEGDDILIGGADDDTIEGGDGSDTFMADAGADGADDMYDLGDGTDTADYSLRTTAVNLSNDDLDLDGSALDASTDPSTPASTRDNVESDIENLTGGSQGDSLTGNDDPNVLRGNGGIDTLTGGLGADTADYANATGSVIVDLGSGAVSGAAGADDLSSVENAIGGASNDNLTGSDGPNVLTGNGSADTLIGGLGIDSFSGGDGDDNIQTRETPSASDTPIACGNGTDTVAANLLPDDVTDPDCESEHVTRNNGPPPPTAPTLTATDPNPPANNNSPKIKGSAPAGTTVDLYTNSDCSGSPVGTGSAASFGSPGLTVAVADDSVTEFYGKAIDASLQPSGCSVTSVLYIEDSFAPDTAISSGPSGTTNDTTPTFAFSSSEPGSSFQCKVDSGSFSTCSSPTTSAALSDGAHTFQARAIDKAGNADSTPASSAFTVKQDVPPPAPIGGGGASTSDKTAPKATISARSVKMSKRGTVKLMIACPSGETGGCSGSVSLGALGKAGFSKIAGGKSGSVTVKLSSKAKKRVKKKKKLSAKFTITARDAAGNTGVTKGSLVIKK